MIDFLFPKHEGLPTYERSMLKGVADELTAFELKKELFNEATKAVFGKKNTEFDDEAKRLDVMIKRRQLGLPLDDDKYEKLTNRDLTSPAVNLTIKKTRGAVMARPDTDFFPLFQTPNKDDWDRLKKLRKLDVGVEAIILPGAKAEQGLPANFFQDVLGTVSGPGKAQDEYRTARRIGSAAFKWFK